MKYFSADWHLGFERDQQLIDRNHLGNMIDYLSQFVLNYDKEDDLYLLGDTVWKMNDDILNFFKKIKCRVHFVMGNHDSYSNLNKLIEIAPKRFFMKRDIDSISVKDKDYKKIIISHYPMAEWDGMYNGAFHLFGHTHSTLRNLHFRSIDVGIDTNNNNIYSLSDIERELCRRRIPALKEEFIISYFKFNSENINKRNKEFRERGY